MGKGIAPIAAQILPAMAIVSLLPAIRSLMRHFGGLRHAALLVPMILTMPALMVALFAPLAGMLADRAGRRVSFLAGMVLYVLAGLVPIVTADICIIVASRAVPGIAEALAVTVSSALIGDYFGERRRTWTAWVGIVIVPAGTALLVAGGFLAAWSWRGPFFISLLAIPALVPAILFIDPSSSRLRASTAPNTRRRPWAGSVGERAKSRLASFGVRSARRGWCPGSVPGSQIGGGALEAKLASAGDIGCSRSVEASRRGATRPAKKAGAAAPALSGAY